MTDPKTLHRGRFLELVDNDGWEYVRRTNAKLTVAILAETVDHQLIFVEQFRPPVSETVIELPAGLVGDERDAAEESAQKAAERELEEETGYRSADMQTMGTVCSSAGLTDEVTVLIYARSCQRVGPGGGVGNESIQIHEIPRNDAAKWLTECVKSGKLQDGKVLTALALAESIDRDQA